MVTKIIRKNCIHTGEGKQGAESSVNGVGGRAGPED